MQLRHRPHQLEAGKVPWRHFTEVFLQQQAHLVVGQTVMVGEVRQVKENIAHAGVFPIQQAHLADLSGDFLIQPVQVEQVVVAGSGDVGVLRGYPA